MTNKKQTFSGGHVAAVVARGCIGKDKAECTVDFALGLLQKENQRLEEGNLEKAKIIVERVLKEVVSEEDSPEALEAWAAKVEKLEEPFGDKTQGAAEANGLKKAPVVATKAQLQAAVKTLGMGPSVYKGLPQDDPAAYCEELQRRVLAFVSDASGEPCETLPPTEELEEVKKAVEARKELSGLDASNIIEGRPKRRAASSAAEAIKRDIARELEKEAAQAASEPQQKKARGEKSGEASGAAAGAAAAAADSSSSAPAEAPDKEEDEDEEDDDEEDEDECEEGRSDSAGSDDSSGSESDAEDEEEEAE